VPKERVTREAPAPTTISGKERDDRHAAQQAVERPYGHRENPLRAPGIVQFALLAVALVDIHCRPAEEIRGSRWLWSAVALVNFMGIGPIVYFAFGRKRA